MLCEYGCGKEAKYQFKNGKWCCSQKWASCEAHKNNLKERMAGSGNPMFGKKHSEETKEKQGNCHKGKTPWNKGIKRSKKVKQAISLKLKGRTPWNKDRHNVYSDETLKKMKGKTVTIKTRLILKEKQKITIEKIKNRYSFFSKIEEMRYNPDKPGEIQIHCKNYNCPNSKEQGGWFTPTYNQLYERIRQLENPKGNDGSYFYCSSECKNICPLYKFQFIEQVDTKPYTQEDYQTFRQFVLDRDNYECQYCGKPSEHVHHERPQKIEPFFALDPDLAWSVCRECHYKFGHKSGTDCSSGNLAYKICK